MKVNPNIKIMRIIIEIILIIDVSGSMKKYKENLLNACEGMVAAIVSNSELEGYGVTLTTIGFDSKSHPIFEDKPISEITPAMIRERINNLPFEYQTNPGPAISDVVTKAIERYEERRQKNAVHPMVYFFSDGKAGPEKKYEESFNGAISQVSELVKAEKLKFITAAFGNKPDMKQLAGIAGADYVINVKNDDISGLESFFTKIIPITTGFGVNGTDVRDVLADLV